MVRRTCRACGAELRSTIRCRACGAGDPRSQSERDAARTQVMTWVLVLTTSLGLLLAMVWLLPDY